MPSTHNSPKYLDRDLTKEIFEEFYKTTIRNFQLWKTPKLLPSRFPEGKYFLNCDNAELKKSPEVNFPVSERHCWAV